MSFGTSRSIAGMPFNSPAIKTTPLSGARKLARHEAHTGVSTALAHTFRGPRRRGAISIKTRSACTSQLSRV